MEKGDAMVRLGILGAGNIAHRFAVSLAHEPHAELVAVSRRTRQGAEVFLSEVSHADGARAYGSHADLLCDKEVDAIYLALPHVLHYEWTLRALRAGKAVLCEKPAMLTAPQMVEVAEVARESGCLFMEAMKPRFAPIYRRVLSAIEEMGPVTHVEATLCNDMLGFVEGTGSYHMEPGPGAGVLLDCGIYCTSWLAAFCSDALELTALDGKQRHGIDTYVNALLTDGSVTARLECAFDRAKPRTATVMCERGRVVVDELHRPVHATVYPNAGDPWEMDIPHVVDDFFGEITHFVGLVEAGACESPVMRLADSVACATIIDTVRAGFEDVKRG